MPAGAPLDRSAHAATSSTTTAAPRSPIRIAGWKISTRRKSPTGWPRKTRSPQAHLDGLPLRATARTSGSPSSGTIRAPACRSIESGRLFYSKNTGLQRQAPIYMRAGVAADPPALVLDPNALSPDGSLSLAQYAPSPDAKLPGLCRRRRRRRLGDRARPRPRDRQGPRRRRAVDALLGPVVDARLEGLLLLALSRAAEEQGARGGALGPGDLLPPRRHAAGGRRADLRAAGSAGVDRRRAVTEDGRYLLITHVRGADNNNQLYVVDLGDPLQPNINAPIKPIVETRRRRVRADRQLRHRASTCAPTRTRRTAGSSRSI